MSIKYQYTPLNESPYASLGKLGSPHRSLNFGNAAQAAPMQIAPDAMELFNTPGTTFNTPVTDAVNNPYLGGMTGLTNNATPDFTDALSQSPSLLETLKGYLETLKGYIPGGFLDSTDTKTGIKTQGWSSPALGVVAGLGNAYMGKQQLNLAKETLANNKRQFDMNYGAQRTTTNARLEDRQRARVNGSAPGTYESVGDYMNKHRVV